MANAEVFDSFFRRADLDRDGRISGSEAVGFFQGSGLPQATLAKIWQFSDQSRAGFLSRHEFINALKLVTVAQTGRDLTPELVKAALNGPAASQIPPPRINTPTPPPSSFAQPPPVQTPPTAPQGNYGQQFPASGFSAAGSGMSQARPSLGGLMGTSSLPSGAQGTHFSSGMGLPTGPGFQTSAAPGLPRPAAPSGMLSSAASLPSAASTPGFQAPGAGAGSLKVGPGSFSSGDLAGLYAQATPTRPAGAGPPSKSRSTPELQGFGGEAFRSNPVGPMSLAPTALPTSSGLDAKPSGVSQTPGLGSGYGARPLSGPAVTPPWPRMNPNDVQRYTRVFSKVDTDHDGKITGEQARQLFLGWQLPREVLKQVWNLSDQDGDSMLSVREFCTALYLMERFREGRPLPASLPPGIHLDDPQGQMPAAQRPGYGGSNWQQQGNMQQAGPGSAPVPGSAPIRPTLLTTPAGQQHLQSLTSTGSTGPEAPKDAFDQFNFLNKKKQPDRVVSSSTPGSNAMPGPNAMPTPTSTSRGLDNLMNRVNVDRKLMDHREKSAYYRSKLQEIVLFKSRCDNKLSEITERAAGDKREVDSLAKKYDEKFKAAAEVNAQLAVENAKLREVQEKKMELLDALFKMEHGGDPNALLQKRADHIATDLDKLKIALRDRGRILGVEVKQKIPKEMPFGWTQNLQEKATEWDDWDELVDRDFSVVQNLTDENTSEEKPSDAAAWGKEEESLPKDEPVPIADDNATAEKEVSSSPEPAITDTSSQNPSETSLKSGTEVSGNDVSSSKPSSDGKGGVSSSVSTTKASERYANVRESHESSSDLFNGPTAASSPTSSLEMGRSSLTQDAFGGIRTSWGFGSNEDDADSGSRASWGLQSNPPSTQASFDVTDSRASRFGRSTGPFAQGGSFDLGSPRTSSVDGTSSPARAFERNGTNHSQDFDSFGAFGSLATSKDPNKTSLFGGTFSPKAASTPSLFGDSPRASNNSFLRFDSFGPGSPVAPRGPSGASEDRPSNAFSRFDSFNSVQTDGARGSGFHSDDESDIFSATGPFSAKQSNVSDGWKAF
ncbi:hypothetical protein M758_9G050500 [Ceratodon purpureus]|nr:hypothetical protein M758_9G050500 [Ceratodon purpureus]